MSDFRTLLDQITRLTGHIEHQADAARDGVPISPDHLAHLAGKIREAVAEVAAVEAKRDAQRVAWAESPVGRNANVVARAGDLAGLIQRMRLGTVSSWSTDGRSVYLADDAPAAGLIEWFYLLSGPKKVTTHVGADRRAAHLGVEGEFAGLDVRVVAFVSEADSVDMVASCAAPSVHLLRRLQIAGAR